MSHVKAMYIRLLTAQAVVYAVISDNIPCKADIITFNFKVQYSFIQEERPIVFNSAPGWTLSVKPPLNSGFGYTQNSTRKSDCLSSGKSN